MPETSLKTALSQLLLEANHQPITYRTICHILAGKGYPALLIILSLPFSTPFTFPGLSTTFGFVIAFIGLRIALGYHLWWPEWLMKKTISYPILEKLVINTTRLMDHLQKYIHPRLDFLSAHPISRRMNGLLIFLLSLLLALPLPLPFTNMLPALPILLISLGLLEDDGLFIIIGYVLSIICFVAFGFLFWKSAEGLKFIFGIGNNQ